MPGWPGGLKIAHGTLATPSLGVGVHSLADVHVMNLFIPGSSNHITGMAEPKVVKFCTQEFYMKASNKMTYHSQRRVVTVVVIVLKFRRLP